MLHQQAPQFVSAAEITRNFGLWQDRAASGPLIVTHHGRPRCVLLAAERYEALAGGTPGGDATHQDAIEFGLLAERVNAGFVALDPQLRVTRANARAALMIGRPIDQALGASIEELIPAFAGGPAGARLRRSLRTGEETHVTAPAGPSEAIEAQVFPWPGGVALLLQIVTTAEEEGEAEAAAIDAALVAHGGIGLVRLTVRGTISSTSDVFAQMVGFVQQRLVGVRVVDLMALKMRARTGDAIEKVLSGGGPQALDGVLLVNSGSELPVRLAFAPLAGGFATAGAEMLVTPR